MSNTVCRKDRFYIPEGMIYLDGNSLGPLPKSVPAAMEKALSAEWGTQLIKGWNSCGWMAQPRDVGDRVAALIGAPAGSVVMGDTLSIKVFQALAAAVDMRPDRNIILSDTGNFPSDLYMAQGLSRLKTAVRLETVDPADVMSAINEDVAVVMLTEVDYRTGRRYDMTSITKAAHDAGAVMIWDLAHSAGAVDLAVAETNCEFAVGCTYKYLNGGPGAPAFIYVRPDLIEDVQPALAGWLGHDAPFDFDLDYRPGQGIERMRVGTPPVLQMTALSAALDVWDDVSLAELRASSLHLTNLFIEEVERRCPTLRLISPREDAERGSQVSFGFENGYAAMQALIARGVIGDFRAPDVMRFGFTPLFIDDDDVIQAAQIIEDVITNDLWDRPEFHARKAVT